MRGEALASFPQRRSPEALNRSQERLLPVLGPFVGLLPGGGLARGSVLATGGPAGVSVALSLAAGPAQAGSWVAVVGLADLGLLAAAGLGVDLERLVLVDQPPPDRWGSVTAALVEAFDVVVARPRHRVRPADARRLQARAREQGSALVLVGSGSAAGRGSWPEAPDLSLVASEPSWSGLEQGHGHLSRRKVTLTVGGRRGAARPRTAQVWLPGPAGQVELVAPTRAAPTRADLRDVSAIALEQAG